jgi:hypothetical protein
LSVLQAPSYPPVQGESSGQRLARIVRTYAGCSLSNRRQDLAALVGRGVDDESIVTVQTNCATFSLGVLAAAGCPHPLLTKPYVNGMAVAWMSQIGNDLGAWRDPSDAPVTGACLWFEGAGNNDHFEWLLDPSEPAHGGGGRPDNAISIEVGQIATSLWRPLHKWLDPERLLLPEWDAGTDVEPHA